MRIFKGCFVIGLISLFWLSSAVFAADHGNFSVDPVKNNGQKWRIGYLEGGPFDEYQDTLKAFVGGLMEIGWVEQQEFPKLQDREDTGKLWQWLATGIQSEYIEFVADAHYSLGWIDENREALETRVLGRLNTKQDVDLMIAMGTYAALDLANDQHHIPTVAMAVSDPIASGVIPSVEDSGLDHFHARVDPGRFRRQVSIFHDIVGFQKLGVAYEFTPDGRSYAAMPDVEAVAEEQGFEIVSCQLFNLPDEQQAQMEANAVKCMEELAPKVDAVYIITQNGFTLQNMPKVLEPLNEAGIPTFSQAGSLRVQYGVLLSIAQAGFRYVGRFHAETVAKIFNGAKPRELDQLFEDPPKIAINLKTAEIIGYDPPVDILGAADEIYTDIAVMEE